MDSQKSAERYNQLANDAGNLQLKIRDFTESLEDLLIQMKNARIDYVKAKKAETPAHPVEATEPTGVTQ